MSFLKSLERGLKRSVIGIIGAVVRSGQPVDSIHDRKNEIRKILIPRLEQRVGNVVMTTFYPEALKACFPDATVDILTHDSVKQLWENNPHVSSIHIFSHKDHLGNPVRFIRFLKELRNTRYDLVIDSSNPGSFSVSNGLLVWFTGAPYRVGFRRGDSEKFLNITVPPDHSKHFISMMHDLLRPVDPDMREFVPEIFISDTEDAEAKNRLNKAGINSESSIIIWPGATDLKQWDLKHFIIAADLISREYDQDILFMCGPAEKELYDQIRNSGKFKVIAISDLRLLSAIIRRSGLFVSGDGGPMHLAYAVGTPTVSIFLQNNDTVYGYDDGLKHRVVNLTGDQDNYISVVEVCNSVLANFES